MDTLLRWSVGLAVALIVGALVTEVFVGSLRKTLNIPESAGRVVPGWLTGLSERLFFTIVIAFNVSGAAIAMMAWVALKLVPNWQLYVAHGTANKPMAWSSLLGSLCSMFFALVGGLIASGRIGW